MHTFLSDDELEAKRQSLLKLIGSYGSCAVALSGGVDSAVVARAAHEALGDRSLAVTAASPSLAAEELAAARDVAARIGIRHRVIETAEHLREGYRRNDADRCFHCKTELYEHLEALTAAEGIEVIANGANLDDLGDHRPGMAAAVEHAVRSPLIEAGCTKDDVRGLAALWQLPVWDKPASPCLASRIAYGEEATLERLALIDRAERLVRELGFRDLRVRYHSGDLARIEVPPAALPRLTEPGVRERLAEGLRALGFRFVTLDLEGLRSGNLNSLVPADRLRILGP